MKEEIDNVPAIVEDYNAPLSLTEKVDRKRSVSIHIKSVSIHIKSVNIHMKLEQVYKLNYQLEQNIHSLQIYREFTYSMLDVPCAIKHVLVSIKELKSHRLGNNKIKLETITKLCPVNKNNLEFK